MNTTFPPNEDNLGAQDRQRCCGFLNKVWQSGLSLKNSFRRSLDHSIINQRPAFRNAVVMSLLVSFYGCATPAPPKRVAAADARPSVGARIGKGAVDGFRYLVGGPFFLGMAILGPLGGASPSVGLEGLRQLREYELPDGSPKPTSYVELPQQ